MSWLKNRLLALGTLAVATAMVLSGCLGDDNNNRNSSSGVFGRVQFYNAVADSPKVMFELPDGRLVGNGQREDWNVVAGYGRGSQRLAITPNEYSLNVYRLGAVSGEYDQLLLNQPLTVVDGVHQFIVMTGDFSAPALKTFTYSTNTDRDALNFDLRVLNFTSDYAQIEVLYGAEGGALEDATLHATISQTEASEFEELGEGRYTLYVVDADTGNLLLTTEPMSFVRNNTYFVSVRDDLATGGVIVDQLNASGFVYSYGVPQTQGQVRIYHSLEDIGSVDVALVGDQDEATIPNAAADQFSPAVALEAGTYSLTITASGASDSIIEDVNVAVPAGQGRDLATLRYDGEVKVLSYVRELLTNAYESQVNIMNLADVRDDEDEPELLKFYLVPSDSYTGDPAVDKPLGIGLTKMSTGTVVNATLTPDDYYVYVAYEVTETVGDTTTTVDVDLIDGQMISIVSGVNNQLIFEPDSTQPSGYRLTLY
ncbi:DUF4397 domain-containing protein [Simiduia agarivorans]|nr:DUF4397 domain-containing protein [Simiduia agarivorans]